MDRTPCHPHQVCSWGGGLSAYIWKYRSLGGGLGFIFPPQGCSKDPCPCLPVCARCFCLQGEMAQPLAAASALTSLSGGPTGGPKGRAVGRVVSWDAAVVEPGICQSKPQVTPSHGPRHIFPGFPSIHHFLNKYTQAVFSIPVCDFLELGVPLPPLPGV